jgi:hypothetical protein
LPRLRPVLAVLAAIAALGPAAPAASAELIERCPETRLQQPFLAWFDPLQYTLVTGAAFEDDTRGWRLQGAEVQQGNEPYRVHREWDTRSLRIPARGSVTTPAMCAGVHEPTLRFFARAHRTHALSGLHVEALVARPGGGHDVLSIGWVPAVDVWGPTAPLPVVANLLAVLPGDQAAIAFRLTAVGSVGWDVDDIYLDPQYRN